MQLPNATASTVTFMRPSSWLALNDCLSMGVSARMSESCGPQCALVRLKESTAA